MSVILTQTRTKPKVNKAHKIVIKPFKVFYLSSLIRINVDIFVVVT